MDLVLLCPFISDDDVDLYGYMLPTIILLAFNCFFLSWIMGVSLYWGLYLWIGFIGYLCKNCHVSSWPTLLYCVFYFTFSAVELSFPSPAEIENILSMMHIIKLVIISVTIIAFLDCSLQASLTNSFGSWQKTLEGSKSSCYHNTTVWIKLSGDNPGSQQG